MADTIFTRIIKKELPSWPLFEDESAIAILDIRPVNKGHSLVIPKRVFANVYDIPEEEFAHLMVIAKRIAIALKKALNADGIKIVMNNEPAAGQLIVDHAHIHVIPRFTNDGLVEVHGKDSYKEGEKELLAEKIRQALA